jgi:hypothetical protein
MFILATALLLVLGVDGPPAYRAGSPASEAEEASGASAGGVVSGRKLNLFLAGSSVGALSIFGDEGGDAGARYSGGVGGDLLWAPARYLRIGFGARYELAYGGAFGRHPSTTNQFFYLPFLIGGVIPLGGDGEIDVLLGVGVMAGLLEGGLVTEDGSSLDAWGPTAELGITYVRPIARSVDLTFGVAGRVAAFDRTNYWSFHGLMGARWVVPLQVGVRWGV